MELITIFVELIVIDYVFFIGLLLYGFSKVPIQETNLDNPKTSFSIIIPFRNEETNFLNLLDTISNLNYPKTLFEVIVIDDFSDDRSVSIFNSWRIKNGLIQTTLLENLRLSTSPKKDAISRAIPVVKYDWIITTDADCFVPKNWLRAFDSYIQKNDVSMLVGTVSILKSFHPLHYFQFMDLMSLQGTTIGSFGLNEAFMCNGANFGYTKELFLKLNGFDGNTTIASGDDVFLLQKAYKKDSGKVGFLKNKEAIVLTQPENNVLKLFMQRVRWASKTADYNNDFAKGLAVTVLLMNLFLVIIFMTCFWGKLSWAFLLIIAFPKFMVDFLLLFQTQKFIEKKSFLLPLGSSLIYPFFCCIVGIYSLFGSFTWKGRNYRK